MMKLVLDTGPTDEPVSLADAKAHLRVDITDDDSYIEGVIADARAVVETISLHALLTQTWRLYLDEWPATDFLELPRPPLQSVTSITYKLKAGTTSTLSTDVYYADINRTPGQVYLKPDQNWPSDELYPYGAICITFVCGWAGSASIPREARRALFLEISDLYEHRESLVIGQQVNPIAGGVEALLWDLRAKATIL